MTDPRSIAGLFLRAAPDAAGLPVHRPSHAAIARVWLLGDRYVLRARSRDARTIASFALEIALLDAVRGRVPWGLPDPLTADDGRRFVVTGEALWTLYPALQGRVLRPWQELHRAPEAERRALVGALRDLHDATRGRFPAADPRWIVRDVRGRLAAVRGLLTEVAAARIDRALARVERDAAAMSPGDLVFVHGDFHWGNLLVGDDGRVAGMLDLDGCRIGHPLEDLGYTAMMLLRDPDLGRARLEDLPRVAEWYGVAPADLPRLHEYFALYTLFDVHLFADASFPGRDDWLDLQVRLAEQVARELV